MPCVFGVTVITVILGKCVRGGGGNTSCALLRLITVTPLFPSLNAQLNPLLLLLHDFNVSFLGSLFWPVFFTTLELSGWLRRLFGKHSEKLSSFRAAWKKKKKKEVFSILRSFISPSDGAALIYLGRLTNRPPLCRCHRHRRQLLTMRLFVQHLWAVGLRGAGASWPKWGRVPLSGWRKAINSISMGSLWK